MEIGDADAAVRPESSMVGVSIFLLCLSNVTGLKYDIA